MKEHGICAKCKKSVGCPYADDRIKGCKKFVLEDELEMTNEEWLRQANTEQVADVIADFYLLGYTHGHNQMDITSRTKWTEWLKEIHHG